MRCYEDSVLPLHSVVLLAGIQGLSEALPVSRSGHDAVAWIWLEPGASAARLEKILHAATGLALLFGARQRLVAAAAAGLRAIARPALFRSSVGAQDAAVLSVALISSLAARTIVEPFLAPWKSTPIATGFGLLLTGILLGTTHLVDWDRNERPTISLAAILGLGHAMGALPGGSDIGAALVLLLWMGTKNDLALDLAMLLSGMTLVVGCLSSLHNGMVWPDIPIATLLVGSLTAFLGTTVAIGATRSLLEKRTLALVALWILPLGFAILAYSRSFSDVSALVSATPLR